MGFLVDIWNGLKDGLEFILRFYEGLFEPVFGLAAWGVAIILLTVTVRIFMIPLMVRQTKSMRSMQALQPELKKLQEKYKADRSMMKTDPERYKKIKDKQREAQMALYQEHQVNPVGGCLPLLLQMPVFFALFQVLQGGSLAEELGAAPFPGIDSLTGTAAAGVGIGAIVLVILQVATTYWSQRQMMARNAANQAAEQAQAQKLMLYIMPVFLGYLSWTFPIGVVLYWVTTNFWTMGQQAFIFRQVEANEAKVAGAREEAKVVKAQRTDVEEVTDTSAKAARKKGEDADGPGLSLDKDAVVDVIPPTSGSSPSGSSPNGSASKGATVNGKAARSASGSRAARAKANAAAANGVVRKPGTGRPRAKTSGAGSSPGETGPARDGGTARASGTDLPKGGRPAKPGSGR